jgi:16S rRNA (cytosine1402-N4)-methyltransferase
VDKVLIADIGVEGGGTTIYGRHSEGVWSFWTEGTSMDLDENDDEVWRSWSSEPVSSLDLVLPDEWHRFYPVKIHPDFLEWFREAYEKARSTLPEDQRRYHDEHRQAGTALAATQTDPTPEKPLRRARYRGKNPRHFHEKYKEHQPDRYPDDVAKVIAGGKTPAGTHRPVMVAEVLRVLGPRPGDVAVDCTVGYGGHARALLAAVQPGGRLLGLDADPIELPKTEARLRGLGLPPESIVLRRMNFAALSRFLAAEAPEGADLLLADLGLSSMQIDDPARGFSFKIAGPLDMRMNPTRGRTASALLSELGESGLAQLLVENSDEPHARDIASAIHRAHAREPLVTTQALATVVSEACAWWPRASDSSVEDLVRRVFQALRIAVNDEFGALTAFLRTLPTCLRPGGRVAILSFHSGEDRRVKSAFKEGLRDGGYVSIAEEVIRPSAQEKRDNPRSSSAKLRFAVRK